MGLLVAAEDLGIAILSIAVLHTVAGLGLLAFGSTWFQSGTLPRMTAGYDTPLGLWLIDSCALAYSLSRCWTSEGKGRILFGFLSAILLAGVILTWYRKSCLVLGAVILYTGWAYTPHKGRLVAVTAVVCALVFGVTNYARNRDDASRASSARSLEGRLGLGVQALETVKRAPWLGTGVAQIRLYAPEHRRDQDTRRYSDPKNLIVHFLCEGGVLGVAWLVLVVVTCWSLLGMGGSLTVVPMRAMLLALLAVGITEVPIGSMENGFGMALFAAIAGGGIRNGRMGERGEGASLVSATTS